MNDSKNSSKGLLVLRMAQVLTKEQVSGLTDAITPTADALGLEPMVLGNGADIRIENGREALLERVCVALEEIAAQGRMPEVNVAENAPQALNARRTETGLNSREFRRSAEEADRKREHASLGRTLESTPHTALHYGADFPTPSADGTSLLQPGEKVIPRG